MLLELIATCCFASFFSFLTFILWSLLFQKGHRVPCIPRRWPIVGNALQVPMRHCHLVFTEWAKHYGAIFEVKLFNEKIVVLNDYKSIHEALVLAGTTFAGRPKMHRTEQRDRCSNSIVWQTYTPKLMFLRKEVHRSLKMYGPRLLILEDICRPELMSLVDRIQALDGENFDPSCNFFESVCNVMLSFVSINRILRLCLEFRFVDLR